MRDDGSVSERSRASRPARGQERGRLTTRLSSTLVLVATAAMCATLLVTIPGGATGAPVPGPIYLDTSYSFGERAADLTARLTPAQRASELVSSQAPQITSVANPLLSPSQLGGQTTLAAPPGAGDTNIKVASVTNMAIGMPLTVDPAGTAESVTVTAVGAAAAAATTLPVAASAGDTNVKVASVTGMTVGHQVRFDTGASLEFGAVSAVGTAAAAATTLPAGAGAGDTNIKVASVTGMTVGHLVRVDTGATLEIGTVSAVGTAAAAATTLAAASAAGATNIKVTSITGITVGHLIRVDTGANLELRTISTVGTAGSAGTGITLTAGLTLAHASGAAAQDLGTGVTLVAPLTLAHAVGAAAQDLGTGITLAAPLTLAHAAGAAAQDVGTGVTFTPALAAAHAFGATVNLLVGIPAYGWWNEALHGVSRESTAATGNAITLTNTTSYPIDQSIASSWDPELMYRVASEIGNESREVVRSNKLDLDFYSPTMNLMHDPRWGRNDESYGEDPLLETKLVSQFVNGMEGKDMNGHLLPAGNGFYKTTTTIKHYAMNNSEVNRRAGSADADDRTIREYYTKAFRGVVEDSQPGAVMSSYNSVNGVPTAADPYLIDTLMRQTFGFLGYFTGDCDAVSAGINPQHHWQPAGFPHAVTVIESLAFALGAGEDAECNAGFTNASNYRGPTAPSTTAGGTMNAIGMNITTGTGLHSVNDLDVSAVRLFTNRMKLGEFDPDSTVPWLTAAQSRVPAGSWVNNNANNAVTETPSRLALAREAADKTLVLLKNATTTRKDGSTGKLLPMVVPPTGAFKVLVIGTFANIPNFYLGGYSSTQGAAGQANEVSPYTGIKNAITAINPSAQVDFTRGFTGTSTTASGQTTVDTAAVASAANYDYVIVYTGTDSGTATEDVDRSAITLPGAQGSLISQVAAVNPNTVAVMETIGPMDVTSWEPSVAASLWSSYNGQRKGEALADVLLGAYNPSGRTSAIWYQNNGQIPTITNYAIRPAGPTGRTYMYYNGGLAYPFGYGLSYSTFSFGNLQIDNHAPTADDTVNVSVDVTNTSAVDGNEVVELYANTPNADPSLQRPIKRLEAFQKVFLAGSQTKTVTFPLKIADLAFFSNDDGRWEVDDGLYGIQVSTSSADADIQQSGSITVSGNLTPKPEVLTARPKAPGDVDRGISQRVMFPENVDIDPGLTVSMNDDSLYGWIDPGKSKPFPSGMTFSYSSDRPGVVSTAGGTVHTVSNGAATVTATATYNGVSKSTSFVVRVLSDLSSISYNGTPVPGFQPDVTTYNVILAPGAPTPTVTATAPSAAVAITQATGVPGTATVTATGSEGIVATYTVNFAAAATSDEFDGATLDPKWTVVRQNANLAIGGGSLTITPEAGQLTTNNATTAKNLVLEPAFGDFRATTKVVFNQKPNAATQQAGLLVYQDDDNYLKFDLEATSATALQFSTQLEDTLNSNPAVSATPIQVLQTLNTTSATALYSASNTIWLRMVRKGAVYTTSYSLDGSTWTTVWSNGATLNNTKVGVYSYSAAAAAGALTSSFEFFHVANPLGAPVTTATFAPPAVNGWFAHNPTVTLTPVDNSGLGLASTTYTVDGGPPQAYTVPFVISGDGTHTLAYGSTDNDGGVEATHTVTVKIDTTPPVVSAALAPAPIGGYYKNPTVTLTSSDATSGSGVALTEYNLDNAGWQIYTLPFQVTGDGTRTLQFRATDTAGNQTTDSVTFKVDATPPVITYTGNAGSYSLLQTVSIHCSVVDPSPGSGVDAAATHCADVVGPAYAFGLGSHTFSADARDLAGNMSTASTTFTVTAAGCLGNVTGPLNVAPGQAACVAPGARVTGPVTIGTGGTLVAVGASFTGPVTSTGAAVVRLCGSTVTGPLTVGGSTGLVVVGGDAATGPCTGNTITGAVQITGNTAGVEFNSNVVTGPVTITGNTGTLPPPDSGSVHVSGNTVTGPVKVQP